MMRMMMMQQAGHAAAGPRLGRHQARAQREVGGGGGRLASRPNSPARVARLHLKANEEDKAFPLIEQLAAAQPHEAKELVERVPPRLDADHDPNAAPQRRPLFVVLLRVRTAGREHPADPLQAGAQPEGAGRVGRAHPQAPRRRRRPRRRDAREGVHRLPQLGRGLPHRGDRGGVRPARRAQAADARGARRPDAHQPRRPVASAGRPAEEQEDQAQEEGHRGRGAARLRGAPAAVARRAQEVPRPLGAAGGRRRARCTTR